MRLLHIPIFWLYLGPPIFRSMGAGDPMAAPSGQLDAWNILRILWWASWGLVALRGVLRRRALLRSWLSSQGPLPYVVLALVLALLTSALLSPAPFFSFGNAGLYAILVLASFDLALRLADDTINVSAALFALFTFSVGLLAIVGLAYVVDPQLVGNSAFYGLRVTGGTVGEVNVLSAVAVFTGLHFATRTVGLGQLAFFLATLGGVAFLALSRTRSTMAAVALGFVAFVGSRIWIETGQRRLVAISLTFLAISAGAGVGLGISLLDANEIVDQAVEYVVRDRASLQSFSGRDGIALVVWRAVSERPLGFGYVAGTRVLLLTSDKELAPFGVVADRIGNAHNSYLEFLAGAGVFGLFSFLGVLMWLLHRSIRIVHPNFVPASVLVLVVVLTGLTSSAVALPFYQASSLFWILVAVFTAHPGRETLTAR